MLSINYIRKAISAEVFTSTAALSEFYTVYFNWSLSE